MTQPIKGSCVCGAVHFQVTPPAHTFQYCHCSRCRKKSGSAHVANYMVPLEQFAWQQGQDSVKRFELPDAKYWCSGFCTECGSAMPWLSRSGNTMIVPAGAFDDDPGQAPMRNIYFGSRAPWYVPASDLATHDESNS